MEFTFPNYIKNFLALPGPVRIPAVQDGKLLLTIKP